MRANDIKARIERLRIPVKQLAAAAGLNAHAAHDLVKGTADSRLSTIEKLDRALTAEEIALRDYLNGLHPPGGDEGREAA